MAYQSTRELSGLEKASMLLMAIGTEESAEVLKYLNESEIEALSTAIVKVKKADPEVVGAVVTEFERSCSDKTANMGDGLSFASKVLETAVGKEKADEFIRKAYIGTYKPFSFLRKINPVKVASLISGETPQLIAVILANLPPALAADVLSCMDSDTQTKVALRICTTGEVDSEVIQGIEEALKADLMENLDAARRPGGPEKLVEILSKSGRSTERLVLSALRENYPTAGEAVRSRLFVFEDLVKLNDKSVQTILRSIDQETLRLSIMGADETVRAMLFENMSERSVQTMKEDIAVMGPAGVREIDIAQQRVVGVARRLLASGQISLATAENEELAAWVQ